MLSSDQQDIGLPLNLNSRIGLIPIINGVGPATRLGGLPLSNRVWQAMREGSARSVRMEELHLKAGGYIAKLLGVPDTLVTCGAAAALTLATAVCLAGENPKEIAELPKVDGERSVVVIQRAHRDPYDHAVTAAGATLREIGYPSLTHSNELIDALNSEVCAILWRPGGSKNHLGLRISAEIAHAKNIPVIVDAAMFVPAVERLQDYFEAGADFIAVSGGKGFRGPHTSGLLCASPSNVRRSLLHHLDMDEKSTTWSFEIERNIPASLPRNGIGRSMKVGREQIYGLLAAIEEYVGQTDHNFGASEIEECFLHLKNIAGVEVVKAYHEQLMQHNVHIAFGSETKADDYYLQLASGSPRIILGQELSGSGILTVNPMALNFGDGAAIARRIIEVIS
jgi:D-glucosaminate-6-phosphate ammonia-lyase